MIDREWIEAIYAQEPFGGATAAWIGLPFTFVIVVAPMLAGRRASHEAGALTGIVASKSAARRAVTEGGAYHNNAKVAAEDAVPSRADLLHGRYLILRRGPRTVGAVDVQLA